MKHASSIVVTGTIIMLVYSIFRLQTVLTLNKPSCWLRESMTYLPQSEKIKPFFLGFSSTYANYLWIKTVLYFGSHYSGDNDYSWLVSMVDMVTKLNPHFYPAYEFAGIILPTFTGNLNASRIILNRGITHIGLHKFTLPLYLGWIYFDRYKDNARAAEFMALASRCPNVPPYIPQLTATLYTNAGQKEMAINFLYSAYLTTENPAVKRAIEEKLKNLIDQNPQKTKN